MTDGATAFMPPGDRVVMISGANRGIGLAIARRLSADGYRLSLGARDRSALTRATSGFEPERTLLCRFDATRAETTQSWLDEMWEVNVKAPFRLIRAALPHLRRAGHGRIVNIASTDAKRYRDRSVSLGYAMTKHALLALSHAAKFTGWDDGVRTTALCPGAVDTNLISGIPGVTPGPGRLKPETVASLVATVLSLPDNASVAELVVNTRLESTL